MAIYALLIVFGAGDARAAKRYLEIGERVLAIEPRPEAANALQGALGSRGSVLTAAAGDGAGEAALTCYDLPEYASEHRLARLSALFPEMKEVGSLSVERIDAGAVVEDAFGEDTATVAIIVDVNGAERAVLDSLSRASAFGRGVGRLEIRCGAEALFDGAMTASDAETYLADAGFGDVKVRGAGPLRTVSGERDLEAVTAAALGAAHKDAETLRAERDAARADLDAARADAEARVRAVYNDLDEARNDLDEARSENARLEQALEEARSALEQAKQKIASQQAEHGEALDAAWADLDAAKTSRDEAERHLETLIEDLGATNSARAQAEAAAGRLQREAEAARMELGTLQSNYESVRQQAVIAEDERARLAVELDAVRRDLASAREEIEAASQESGEALNAAWAELENANKARAAAEDERKRLAAELEAQIAAGALRERSAREDADAALGEAREALHHARNDLSLALHSKAMAEDDLRDLRRRFAELAEVKERQDDLLHRLSHRLGEASRVLASAPETSVFEALIRQSPPAGEGGDAKKGARKSAAKPDGKGSGATKSAAKARAPRKKKTAKSAK
jgi:FkbM family methyltransferase